MAVEIPHEQALFPVTVTAVRREVSYARLDGCVLIDGAFARLHAFVRGACR